jgi:hypothetical protein
MALYRVREGYVVHLPGTRQTLSPGEVFEPSPEVLTKQSWKIEPVQETEPVKEEPKPETKEVKKPPRDRAIKPGETVTK